MWRKILRTKNSIGRSLQLSKQIDAEEELSSIVSLCIIARHFKVLARINNAFSFKRVQLLLTKSKSENYITPMTLPVRLIKNNNTKKSIACKLTSKLPLYAFVWHWVSISQGPPWNWTPRMYELSRMFEHVSWFFHIFFCSRNLRNGALSSWNSNGNNHTS